MFFTLKCTQSLFATLLTAIRRKTNKKKSKTKVPIIAIFIQYNSSIEEAITEMKRKHKQYKN